MSRWPSSAGRAAAQEALDLARELQPLCRSITGEGLRGSLRVLAREVPLTIHEVPSGTMVFDWTVPKEWNIRDAYIKNADGVRLVDFRQCSLHVVNYSVPVKARMTRAELDPHLHSLKDRPDAVPYKTSYYRETWGFCLSQKQREQLGEGPFDVCIDSTLAAGDLTYGELLVQGVSSDEVLISVHCCHPWMANDNLSGMVLGVQLAKHLLQSRRRLSYRFLFIPGTIGSLTWLSRNDPRQIRHGLVLTCLGDAGPFTYKETRDGNAYIDRVVRQVLAGAGAVGSTEPFAPYGYDERQYNSPGFKLPVGCLMRTPNGRYPEYHTSDDNLDLITTDALAGSFDVLCEIMDVLENDGVFLNTSPHGEPQLGKYGLYSAVVADNMPLLWVLNLSDGGLSLLDIAERSKLPFHQIRRAADRLMKAGLLKKAPSHV